MIILNGKKAGEASVRSAISTFRARHGSIEVRSTYEYGDVARFVDEAIGRGIRRIVIGGGDGSINEMVDKLAKLPRAQRPELAILPLGTANDFATACEIPVDHFDALELAFSGSCTPVDIATANERHFANIATAGFGADITAQTPVELKNFLGGGAYTLMGLLKAINFVPYQGRIKTPDYEADQTGVIAAVCNGRQAGGGQVLAPKALINDGLLDVMIVTEFSLANIAQMQDEIQNPSPHGRYIKYFQTPWMDTESEGIVPVNLDGEPYRSKNIHFEILPEAIDLVLPKGCPCVRS